MVEEITRCEWCTKDEVYIKYHDEEWGKINKDDKTLFEFLILESAQAGLSWLTILKKRENYRIAYDDFDYEKVSKYNTKKVESLLVNPGIIKNKRKILASINNAKCFIKVQKEFGSFYNYIWSFLPNQEQIINSYETMEEYPSSNILSEKISEDMKNRGFRFIGPTIIFSYLEAIGVMNNHMKNCFLAKNK